MARRGVRTKRHASGRRGAARRTGGRLRFIVFGAIALSVVSLAGFFLWPAVKPTGAGGSGAVTVQPSMAGFSPSRIEARAGEPLTIRLVNEDTQFHTDGAGWHQFAIDELGVDVKVPPVTTKEFTFTPTVSGTYGFYCSVCGGGKENPSMWGTLVVTG